MTVRVAVVDDDDITLTGTCAILAASPDIDVVRGLSHLSALADGFSWQDVDVALIDASDRRRLSDHFPGVAVVERIRAERTSRQTRVIVLTGVMFDDAIRRRMREAGADFYYHRSQLLDAAVLCEVVLHPDVGWTVPEPADPEFLFRLGISPSTRVNRAVAAAREEGLLDGTIGGRGRDRTRRRERVATQGGLHVVTADGRPPDREQRAPSLPQINRFLRWATRLRDTNWQ